MSPDKPTPEKDENSAEETQPVVDSSVQHRAAGDDFARQAEQPQMGLLAEFWDFLKHEKKWWLTPIIVVLLLLGGLVILASMFQAATPFIYPLF